MGDTIVAAATAPGESGIGIVRLSGSQSVNIARRCFSSTETLGTRPRFAELGKVVVDGEVIDEGLGLVFLGPKSYTGEDVVEIQCHGNPLIIQKIIKFAVSCGARVAGPGEFTKRAFLNGRLDLMQAEAVVDLIKAESEVELRDAYGQARGRLSELVKHLKEQVVSALALIEVGLDFSDEDIDEIGRVRILEGLKGVLAEATLLVDQFEAGGRRMRGSMVAIVGPANVGKSTLLNHLLGEERAIVSSRPGTTRDTVEGHAVFGGRSVRLVDTAGIRDSEDVIELEGISKTKQKIQDANLVLLVVDSSDEDSPAVLKDLIPQIACPFIVVVNKIDLVVDHNVALGDYPQCVFVSGHTSEGLGDLQAAVEASLADFGEGGAVALTRDRHANLLSDVCAKVAAAISGLELGHSDECVAVDLHGALGDCGLLLGEDVDEDVLDAVFSEFCIGK